MNRILAAALIGATTLSLPLAAQAAPKGCPPGLAKKSETCTPPGQAKKSDDRRDARHDDRRAGFHRGDRLNGDYRRIDNPARYGLNPNESYYRVGDQVYRVDSQTKEILDVIGAVAALAN